MEEKQQKGEKVVKSRVFEERNAEYDEVEWLDEGGTWEGESLGGGRFIDWTWNRRAEPRKLAVRPEWSDVLPRIWRRE